MFRRMAIAIICALSTGSRTSLSDLAKGDQVTVEFQTGGGQYTALKVTSQ